MSTYLELIDTESGATLKRMDVTDILCMTVWGIPTGAELCVVKSDEMKEQIGTFEISSPYPYPAIYEKGEEQLKKDLSERGVLIRIEEAQAYKP